MKNFGKYLLRNWLIYLIALIAMVISILLDLIAPMVIQRLIDDVIIGRQLQILMGLLVTLLLIGCGRAIFVYTKEFLFDLASINIACEVRGTLFRHLQTLSVRFFNRNNTGELMARVKDDVDKIWNAIGFVGMLTIESVIHCGLTLYFMFRINPYLTLIPIVLMPIVAYNALRMEFKLNVIYDHISEENAVLTTVAQENLAGVRTVKAFAREDYETDKFLQHNENYYRLNMKQARTVAKYNPNIQFITRIILVLVTIIGGIFVVNQQISLGQLGAFAEYAAIIMWPMELLGWLVNDIASAIASNRKIKKIMAEKAEIISPERPIDVDHIHGELEFRNVSFSIDDTSILNNISFTLKPGQTLGIMGSTGAGKSSIVNLIERFYDVDKGAILLDGLNVKEYDLKQLRSNISLVMQDVFLFSDTVKDNLSIGNKGNLSLESLHDATRFASAQDFIENLNNQYDTVIGERGVGLSGGQRQRISIARAFAKNAPILILDDSTSALDMETEHQIQEALNHIPHNSKLIIAHRISALRDADEIIILEEGAVVERGTHQELLKKKGLYYETYQSQYGNYSFEEVKV